MAKFDVLTLFFPMFNEKENLEQTLAAAREIGDDLVTRGEVGSYEVLVVDDGSTDGSAAMADRFSDRDARVRVVRHPANQGLGAAIRTGLGQARGEVVLYSDMDLPFDLGELPKALRLMFIYQVDLVCAWRLDRTGEGLRRAISSFVYNWLIRILFGVRVRDINFSFKLFHRRALEELKVARSQGSFIDAELMVRADRRGLRVIQFGVDYFPRMRGTSTLSSFRVIRGIWREMLALRPELRRIRPRQARGAEARAEATMKAALPEPETSG